ncbi:MAG: hypothetical protein KTR27_06505 [Leptolyngbyaceae cyanobacterium MAG.088]|nr:hypothetical protein [Leptolyngbyaceae cyanobacterium MAG.088]
MAIASAVLTLSKAQASWAQTVFYDFTVDITSGPLVGERYTGDTSADVTNLSQTGNETLQQTSINFIFGDVEFTEADDVQDSEANSPRANFQDGEFIGNTYIVSRVGETPTEIPLIDDVLVDGFAIDNNEFGYVVGANLYRGTVNYALLPNADDPDVQSVPEPAFWLGFATVGYWLRRHRA